MMKMKATWEIPDKEGAMLFKLHFWLFETLVCKEMHFSAFLKILFGVLLFISMEILIENIQIVL